ncbi:MAG TPA: hypothetical protein DIU15_03375, partial [Deltaproteobacteria bacterium]|nr:hypothetical protein [Deltaproteobacteria bacterium]
AAASAIDCRLGPALGRAAMVNAIDFMACAQPSRPGTQGPQHVPWSDPLSWRCLIREGAIEKADGQLVDLMARADCEHELAPAWFQAGGMTSSGWGHGAIGARTFWAIADAGLASRQRVLRAGMRLWFPYEETLGLDAAIDGWEEEGVGPWILDASEGRRWTPALVSRPEPSIEPSSEVLVLSQAILEGRGESAFCAAMLAGLPPAVLAASACVAACRVFIARPALRQLHAITFSRSVLDAVRVSGVEVRVPLWLAQNFVAESWQLALRSGRIRQVERVLKQVDPPEFATSHKDAALQSACHTEAAAVFGHSLKLCDACLDLEEALPDNASGWAVAALVAAGATWPKGQRPWLALCRALDQ